MNRKDEMRQQCIDFHCANPRIFQLFEEFTLSRIRRGFKNYSAQGIWERIRWETATPENPSGFKLNNNYVAFYARAFMRRHPQYEGFFRTRHQTSEAENATGLPELGPAYFDQPGRQL